MSLVLQSSGGGQVTLQEPATASNFTLSLPAANTTAVGTDATQTLTNKTINASQLVDASITAAKLDGAQSGSAPIYAARAWVNFNGTGTVAIRASGNITSITDNGVGDYTVNFTTAMASANYAFSGVSCGSSDAIADSRVWVSTGTSPSTTTCKVYVSTSSAAFDAARVGVTFHG